MLQPIHTPLAADTAPPAVMLTTLAVRRIGGVEALVILHLGDGGREPISPSQARKVAQELRTGSGAAQPAIIEWADSLDEAAETAERQASAVLMEVRSSHGVGFAREFRGPR